MTWMILPAVPCCALEAGLGGALAGLTMVVAAVLALLAIRDALRHEARRRTATAGLLGAGKHRPATVS